MRSNRLPRTYAIKHIFIVGALLSTSYELLFAARIQQNYSRGGWLSQKKGCFKNVDWAWAPWLASSKIYIIWIMNPCSVHRCKFWSLPISARVLNLLWRAGHFLPQIVHSNSSTAPIWNIFHGVEFLLEKNIIATKMKEIGWVVGVLWGFEPFSYRTHHIRA